MHTFDIPLSLFNSVIIGIISDLIIPDHFPKPTSLVPLLYVQHGPSLVDAQLLGLYR